LISCPTWNFIFLLLFKRKKLNHDVGSTNTRSTNLGKLNRGFLLIFTEEPV
jgi:hypothetical protein